MKNSKLVVPVLLAIMSACLSFLFNEKKSKPEILKRNKAKGKAAEKWFVFWEKFWGNKVTRSPNGEDYVVERWHFGTDKVDTVHVEVKSGKAKLSKNQLAKQKKYPKNYEVRRINPILY